MKLVLQADRILLTGHAIGETPAWELEITDPAQIEAVKRGFASCRYASSYNNCMPSAYCISMFREGAKVVVACPTFCCGIFSLQGHLYEDADSQLRDAVLDAIDARRSELPEKLWWRAD